MSLRHSLDMVVRLIACLLRGFLHLLVLVLVLVLVKRPVVASPENAICFKEGVLQEALEAPNTPDAT